MRYFVSKLTKNSSSDNTECCSSVEKRAQSDHRCVHIRNVYLLGNFAMWIKTVKWAYVLSKFTSRNLDCRKSYLATEIDVFYLSLNTHLYKPSSLRKNKLMVIGYEVQKSKVEVLAALLSGPLGLHWAHQITQDNLSISTSFTSSHLQSAFCHIR